MSCGEAGDSEAGGAGGGEGVCPGALAPIRNPRKAPCRRGGRRHRRRRERNCAGAPGRLHPHLPSLFCRHPWDGPRWRKGGCRGGRAPSPPPRNAADVPRCARCSGGSSRRRPRGPSTGMPPRRRCRASATAAAAPLGPPPPDFPPPLSCRGAMQRPAAAEVANSPRRAPTPMPRQPSCAWGCDGGSGSAASLPASTPASRALWAPQSEAWVRGGRAAAAATPAVSTGGHGGGGSGGVGSGGSGGGSGLLRPPGMAGTSPAARRPRRLPRSLRGVYRRGRLTPSE